MQKVFKKVIESTSERLNKEYTEIIYIGLIKILQKLFKEQLIYHNIFIISQEGHFPVQKFMILCFLGISLKFQCLHNKHIK